MKRPLLFITLLVVLLPTVSSWEMETREVKDEFGDITSEDDYYIEGSWNDKYTDKYIFFYFEDNSYLNGYMSFGEQGSKSNETYTAIIKMKEQDGTVQTYSCSGKTRSNSSYWNCLISLDIPIVRKMIDVFTRNDSVKIVVTYGKTSETYNYGSVDCSDFFSSPICIKLGHNFDGGVVSTNPTCMTEGTRTFSCLNCGVTQERTIEALGHEFVEKECTRCAAGHKGQAGGVIFYDCDADNEVGNPDGLKSDMCGWRYLEVAPADIVDIDDYFGGCVFGYYRKAVEDNNRYVSGYTKYDPTSCTRTGVGTGKRNTELLVNSMGETAYEDGGNRTTTDYAAKLCDDYTYGGYDDWFLPSISELEVLYTSLVKNGLGGFAEEYWSSSEYSSSPNYSYSYAFSLGNSNVSHRGWYIKVRAIRAF